MLRSKGSMINLHNGSYLRVLVLEASVKVGCWSMATVVKAEDNIYPLVADTSHSQHLHASIADGPALRSLIKT